MYEKYYNFDYIFMIMNVLIMQNLLYMIIKLISYNTIAKLVKKKIKML